MNKQETIEFIKLCDDPRSISKAFSEWAKENWEIIDTQCYISVKAKNILDLLGFTFQPWETETNNTQIRAAHYVAHTTGNKIRDDKEKADGWMPAIPSLFKNGEIIEMMSDGGWGTSIIRGKLIKNETDGSMFLLPKRHRTRGYPLGTWQKIRIAKGAI